MSKVSRSVYQKVAEENKRLMSDIKILTEEGFPSAEKILLVSKWRNHFQKEREFNEFMRLAVRDYIKKNPNDPAVIATKEIQEKVNKG